MLSVCVCVYDPYWYIFSGERIMSLFKGHMIEKTIGKHDIIIYYASC